MATEEIKKMTLKVCDTESNRFRNWFALHWRRIDSYKPIPKMRNSLLVASYLGHWTIAQLLVDAGEAKIESTDSEGQTPLLLAAMRGHEAVVKLLLVAGAAADTRNRLGKTPLFLAAARGCDALV